MNPRLSASVVSSGCIVLCAAAGTVLNGGEILWHNATDFVGGLSNMQLPGLRRSVLDDFDVTDQAWVINKWHTKHAWEDGSTGTGTDVELTIFRDRDGAPDFDAFVAFAVNRSYTEMRDPNNPNFFGLTVVDIWVTFDEIIIGPGRYWIDMNIIGPVGGYQVKGLYPQSSLEPVWVDYEDFGGRQPGHAVFGDDYDVTFTLFGTRDCTAGCPVPADDFTVNFGAHQSGGVDELRRSDDEYLVIAPRPGITASFPVIRMELTGICPIEDPSSLLVTYESAANSVPNRPPQRLSLFDHDASAWEAIDERIATFDDTVVEVEIDSNAPRFIDPQTRAVTMRAEYFNPGNVIRPSWVMRIDQARWRVTAE